ncbi:MAG: polysaccharide deacetylase family protein, partial [Pseudomonadota bacterium]
MSRMSTPFLKAVLRGLHAVRADRLFARAASPARGVIFMLHHVLPHEPKAFSPNRILKVTPAFLEAVVEETRRAGFDCISLDEAEQRLTHSDGGRPFACFTFDDGYLDNATYAYPILKRHGVPFAVYVTPAFADGRADLWWLVLEEAIARSERVTVPLEAGERTYATATP